MIKIGIKNFSFIILLSIASAHLSANETEVPTDKIQQFVDVYKKIKDQYVDEIDDEQLFN